MRECVALIHNEIVACKVGVADNYLKRLIGLLGHKKLENGEGLLITNCKQIHTFGMKFPIDTIFLSKDGKILYINENIKANKISKSIKGAYMVLELEAGTVSKYQIKLQTSIEFKN